MLNEQIIKNFQKIYEQQQQRAISSRQSTQFLNKAKINFPNKEKIQSTEKYGDLFQSNQGIDPWNQNSYSKYQDIKGIMRLKESSNKLKRSNYHRGVSNKSWNGEKDKFYSSRKPVQLANPMFEPEALSQPNQKNLICYLRRKNEEAEIKKYNSEGNKLFSKHRKLLSRIYSHSCDGRMIIKHVSRQAVCHQVSPIHRKIASSPQIQMFKDNHVKKEMQKDPKILFNMSLNFKKIKQIKEIQQLERKPKVSAASAPKVSHFFSVLTPKKMKKDFLQIL